MKCSLPSVGRQMGTVWSTEGSSGPHLQAVSEEVSPLDGAVRSAGALRTGELLPVLLHETCLFSQSLSLLSSI